MSIEFRPYGKTPRYFREIQITEKIDGTNAAVIVIPLDEFDRVLTEEGELVTLMDSDKRHSIAIVHSAADNRSYVVAAQSRKRLITPGKATDNFGFAGFVERNAQALVDALGPGTHYGEWWGSGIQRGYGLQNGEKRFSLFNTQHYFSLDDDARTRLYDIGVEVVPVLYTGPHSTNAIRGALAALEANGSRAARFDRPEGVVVRHSASGQVYKALLEHDELPKSVAA